ncbi:MAG: phosphotransferase [Phycisphaerales bacterium]
MTPGLTDASELAHALEPALLEACAGRLASPIRWFRTDWQRGGAATGFSTFRYDGEDKPRDVVVKLPIGPTEHRTLVDLAKTDAPTPRVAADGWELGAYDVGWVVMERFPGAPLSMATSGVPADAPAHERLKSNFEELAAAAAVYYKCAEEVWPIDHSRVQHIDWAKLLDQGREAVKVSHIAHEAQWTDALKKVQKGLAGLLARWDARPITTWKHGDLHAGNAMRRPDGSPWGPSCCVLLDFAEVSPGHWVEDAVYMERLHWAHMELLNGVKPVSILAKARKAVGLDNGEDYGDLANIRRVLVAASAPAFLRTDGNPRYLDGALGVLEKLTPAVVR